MQNADSDLEKLTDIIQKIIGFDASVRKENEKVLREARKRDVNLYFELLLQLIKTSNDPLIRVFCAVTMEKQLVTGSEGLTPSWQKISGETAKSIKDELFTVLRNEITSIVRSRICSLIGALGGKIMNMKDDEEMRSIPEENKAWPELMGRVGELWLSNTDTLMEASLKILTTLFSYENEKLMQYKDDFHVIFKSGMEHPTFEIKAAAIDAFCSLLEAEESNECKIKDDGKLQSKKANLKSFQESEEEKKNTDKVDPSKKPEENKNNDELRAQLQSKEVTVLDVLRSFQHLKTGEPSQIQLNPEAIKSQLISFDGEKYPWLKKYQADPNPLNVLEIDLNAIAIIKSKNWPNLQSIAFASNSIDEACAIALSESRSWPKLEKLHLSQNSIGDQGMIALSKSTIWPNLQILKINKNSIGWQGAKALSESGNWPKLRELSIGENSIGNEGANALSRSNSWPDLESLYLHTNFIGKEGAKALSKSRNWSKLRNLGLSNNSIGDEGVQDLSESESWPDLQWLSLSKNSIGTVGAIALSDKNWTKLKSLGLSNNSIGHAGALALSKNSSWKNLQQLNLSSNDLGVEVVLDRNNFQNRVYSDKGTSALSKNTSWINLTTLDLSCNNINEQGAIPLSKNIPWKLTTLNLQGNQIYPGGTNIKNILTKRWPNIDIKL